MVFYCGDTVEGYPEPALQQKTKGGGGGFYFLGHEQYLPWA